jgi:hypothetical protein
MASRRDRIDVHASRARRGSLEQRSQGLQLRPEVAGFLDREG